MDEVAACGDDEKPGRCFVQTTYRQQTCMNRGVNVPLEQIEDGPFSDGSLVLVDSSTKIARGFVQYEGDVTVGQKQATTLVLNGTGSRD